MLAAGCSDRTPRARLHRVVIERFQFNPARLEIAAGDTVEWRNRDIVPHTATSQSGRWNSGTLAPDSTWRNVFAGAGAEPYSCTLHPTMLAEVHVR